MKAKRSAGFGATLPCGHRFAISRATFWKLEGTRRIRCNQCWGKPKPRDGEGSALAERELLHMLREEPYTRHFHRRTFVRRLKNWFGPPILRTISDAIPCMEPAAWGANARRGVNSSRLA